MSARSGDDRERLERLLAFRRTRERQCQARVGTLVQRVSVARRRLQAARNRLRERDETNQRGAEPAARLIDAQRYARRLKSRVEECEEAVRVAEKELAEAREELTEAGRERLAIERLLSARRRAGRRRQAAASQAALDDRGRILRMNREG